MKKLAFAAALSALISPCFAIGSLENPVSGSTESGIGVISGWHCTATSIDVLIDGLSYGKAGSGTNRGDTVSVCGRTNTGYSLLFNYNDLAPGAHSLSLYTDGQLAEIRPFNTAQSAGASFVTGISKTATIPDFPSSGRTATLQWSQAKQSFVVTGISSSTAGSDGHDLSLLQGSFNQTVAITSVGSTCVSDGVRFGNVNFNFVLAATGNDLAISGYTSGNICTMHLSYMSGNSTSGFNMSGSEICTGGLPVSLAVTNFRKINNHINGVIAGTWPSCMVTTTFN